MKILKFILPILVISGIQAAEVKSKKEVKPETELSEKVIQDWFNNYFRNQPSVNQQLILSVIVYLILTTESKVRYDQAKDLDTMNNKALIDYIAGLLYSMNNNKTSASAIFQRLNETAKSSLRFLNELEIYNSLIKSENPEILGYLLYVIQKYFKKEGITFDIQEGSLSGKNIDDILPGLINAGKKFWQNKHDILEAIKQNKPAWYIEDLLKKVDNVNFQTVDGFTPLMFAAMYRNIPAVNLLLNSGAIPDITNINGKTALDLANNEIRKLIRSKIQAQVMPFLSKDTSSIVCHYV